MKTPRRPVTVVIVLVLALTPATAAAGMVLSARPGLVSQPAPPVTASDFPMEPQGTAPADGDGLIPNPATPAGSPIGPPSSCTVTFASASGATSATVNAWIAAHENTITAATVVCLSGTFSSPIQVWSKSSTALLEIAPEPGSAATLALGQVQAADTNPDQGTIPHRSVCFLNGGACSDIYILDNTVDNITNTADENHTTQADCNKSNIDAYGIAAIAAGASTSPALQHLVIEGNTVENTRTGQSETVTINGDITDFLAADNVIHDTDNIGLDTIGWETGTAQARHGLVQGNTVYNVDTYSNAAYGKWNATAGTCGPRPENAAGLYDDGASYVWINSNVVWNTDQGINLDVETANKETDHLLVSGNTVYDDPGTAKGDPSDGTNPPGAGGTSTVAGHDPYALYVDAFGSKASIEDVYVHDNTLRNQSQYFLTPGDGMPVLDLGGLWSNVQIWHNTISGGGPADRYNTLFEVDHQPSGGANTVDCNDYENLSTASSTVNGNFALPSNDWLTLAQWQARNGHGWDADSAVGGFSASCPGQSIQ